MAKEVVITNSKVNSYGSRVITSGIDLTQYTRNPILLWMHNRPFSGRKDEVLPLGYVDNIRVEGDDLIGIPFFDKNDEFARQIESKWENGILKMVSAGLDIVELSDDPALSLPGQRRMTITRSKLVEVSIVDIGANDDAIALYKDGNRLNLSAGDNCEIPLLTLNKIEDENMKTIALKLGLSETATEAEILAKIGTLLVNAEKSVTLQTEMDTLKLANITSVVDTAVSEKRITEDKKEHFINLGKAVGVASLKDTLSLMEPAVRPLDLINRGGGGGTGVRTEFKKLSDVPAEEVMELRKNRAEYTRLFKAEYGFEPVLED